MTAWVFHFVSFPLALLSAYFFGRSHGATAALYAVGLITKPGRR